MVKVIKGVPAGWGACSRTTLLSGPTHAISYYNNSIAVGSKPGDIIILNAITGSQSTVLSGHTERVNCVVFSSDGTSLVSGSHDKTIMLWDIQTGGVVKTFFGHTSTVWSVSISADLTTIASGSEGGMVCLWNIQKGDCYYTIKQQQNIYHVMFSPKDPQHLISISHNKSISDNKVWQWDGSGCQIRPPFDGNYVAFSLDGAHFVSCFKKTISVHDSSSGAIVTKFHVPDSVSWPPLSPYVRVSWVSFSPDNRLVAVTVDKTAYCWDITTSEPQLVETFVGHTQWISSLIFSSSTTLISVSEDKSAKFWQIGAKSTDPSTSLPSAPIEFVLLQSKESVAITSDTEGVIKAWDISTGICKTTFQTPAQHSENRGIQLVNGRVVFVWYIDEKICVWDVENGKLLWEAEVPWPSVEDLRISGDGFRVFCLSAPYIWAWSLQTGEVVGKMKINYIGMSGSLIVDGSRVWVHWPESNYKGWDFSIPGSTSVELRNSTVLPSFNGFWDPKQAGIKNPATGEIVFQLSGRFSSPVDVQCDDTYLVAGYQSGEILILDLKNIKYICIVYMLLLLTHQHLCTI